MTASNSPFNWQGKPSIFVKSDDHNGVNHGKSVRLTKMEKSQPVYLTGSSVYLRVPTRQVNAHSKAGAK